MTYGEPLTQKLKKKTLGVLNTERWCTVLDLQILGLV